MGLKALKGGGGREGGGREGGRKGGQGEGERDIYLSLLLCVQPLKDDHMRTQQEGGCLSQDKSSHQKTMLNHDLGLSNL